MWSVESTVLCAPRERGRDGDVVQIKASRRLNGESVELQPAAVVTAVTFSFSVICKLRKWRVWRWSKPRHERGGSGLCVSMATQTAWEYARGGARASSTATAASAVGFDPTGRRCFLSRRCYQPSISDSEWSVIVVKCSDRRGTPALSGWRDLHHHEEKKGV